mgnify:CR=1 FL=1
MYSNTAYIWSKENLLINYYQNSYSSVVTYDTVCNDKSHKGSLRIPQSIGGGLSYSYKDKLLVAADVTWQNWKQYKFMGHSDSLKDAITASLGCQYIPNPLSKKFFQKMAFRVGAKYSTGNFLIKNKPITEFGVSLGVGIPLTTFNTHSTINVMFEYGKMGTLENDLLKQNYFKFTFNTMHVYYLTYNKVCHNYNSFLKVFLTIVYTSSLISSIVLILSFSFKQLIV